jgi:hypothetical protein
VRLRLADEPRRGLDAVCQAASSGSVSASASPPDPGRLRRGLDLVQVDVGAALLLVVLDPHGPALELLRPLPDLLAERRVLLALRVAHDVAHVPALRFEGADVGDGDYGLHACGLPRTRRGAAS